MHDINAMCSLEVLYAHRSDDGGLCEKSVQLFKPAIKLLSSSNSSEVHVVKLHRCATGIARQ